MVTLHHAGEGSLIQVPVPRIAILTRSSRSGCYSLQGRSCVPL